MKKIAILSFGVVAVFLCASLLLAQPPKDRPEGPPGPPDHDKLFKEMDKDGDGKLSLEEFKAGMREFHKRSMRVQRGPQMGMMGGPRPDGPPMDGPRPDGPPMRGMGGPRPEGPMMGMGGPHPGGPMGVPFGGHVPGFGPGSPQHGPAPIIIVASPEMLHAVLSGHFGGPRGEHLGHEQGKHHGDHFGREHGDHHDGPRFDHPDSKGPRGEHEKELEHRERVRDKELKSVEQERKFERRAKELRERKEKSEKPENAKPCPPDCNCPKCKKT